MILLYLTISYYILLYLTISYYILLYIIYIYCIMMSGSQKKDSERLKSLTESHRLGDEWLFLLEYHRGY